MCQFVNPFSTCVFLIIWISPSRGKQFKKVKSIKNRSFQVESLDQPVSGKKAHIPNILHTWFRLNFDRAESEKTLLKDDYQWHKNLYIWYIIKYTQPWINCMWYSCIINNYASSTSGFFLTSQVCARTKSTNNVFFWRCKTWFWAEMEHKVILFL